LPPSQQIDVTGFNILRRDSGGPWFVLFNPSSTAVGSDILVDLDSRLFAHSTPPAAGSLIDAGALKLIVSKDSGPPRGRLVVDHATWTFSDARYRTFLITAFDSFMARCEALEKGPLQPGASEVLRRVVAQHVPTTFAENLYLAHGLYSQDNPGQTYFDLQPGMRLRLDFESRQFVPPAAGAGALSGVVGGPSVTAEVVGTTGPSGLPAIGGEAVLRAVRLPPVPVAPGGFGDVVDLAAALVPRPRHVRFCFPARFFPAADSGGAVGAAGNIAVLGAGDLASLAKATTAYYATGDPGAALIGYFRGRTVVQPQIPILFNGTERHYVPVGTTARQLLERFAPAPRIPGFLDGGASTALNYQRRHGGLDDVSTLYGSASYAPVTLAAGDLDPSGADALDFPVLAADVFHPPTGADHG
jgi:hypothetical protein